MQVDLALYVAGWEQRLVPQFPPERHCCGRALRCAQEEGHCAILALGIADHDRLR